MINDSRESAVILRSHQLCIHDLIDAYADRNPDAVAIVAPGRTPLTYSRLRRQIDDVAQMLHSMGMGRGDHISLVLRQGPEMPVAVLAVAAVAGCAPLNPTYQTSEFDFYLSSINAAAVLVEVGVDSPARDVAISREIPIIEISPEPDDAAGVFTLAGIEPTGCRPPGLSRPHDVAVLLHTSGTTSEPKLVPLTHANLFASIDNMRVTLALDERDRCLNVMPFFHIHGLMTAFASLSTGGSLTATGAFDATRFFAWIDELSPTWYSAVPTMHRAILARAERNREIIARCRLRFIRSSSAALPTQMAAELERVFGVPVIEAYGMTEATHQIASNPLPPQQRKAGSVGPPAGPEVAILDEAGQLLPAEKTGEIAIRGASIMRGYEGSSVANFRTFTNGWFRTGDQGHLDGEGYLFITGRLKEIINRGGEKISPHEVDAVLANHPAVEQVSSFAVPHPYLGEEIAAAIVLRAEAEVSGEELREFARQRLADFKVPRLVMILEEIPKGPTGKVERIHLARTLGLLTADHAPADMQAVRNPSSTIVAPRDLLELQLAKIWEEVLEIDSVGACDDFFDLGGHSLLAVRLLVRIEEVFARRLPPGTLFNAPTVERLANILRQDNCSVPPSPLVPIQPHGSQPPLFCVHGHGGTVFCYQGLASHLGQDQPLYGLEARGLDGQRAPHKGIRDMATHYLTAIRALQPEGPYFLGGFCFGGLVALDIAQQLQAQGQQVALVALFDSYGPRNGDCAPEPSAVLRVLTRTARRIVVEYANLTALSPKEKLAYMLVKVKSGAARIKAKIARHLGLGPLLPPHFRTVHEAHRQAIRDYSPHVYRGHLLLFWARHYLVRFFMDPQFGWGGVTSGRLDIRLIPGIQGTVLDEPRVRSVAEQLQEYTRGIGKDRSVHSDMSDPVQDLPNRRRERTRQAPGAS